MADARTKAPSSFFKRTLQIDRLPILGALVLVVTAYFSTGFHHWDEHFQILEFAGYKLGITPAKDLPWEFAARIRPALQPLIVVLSHHLFGLFGSSDPFAITFFLRLLSAALSFTAIMLMLRAFLPEISDERLRKGFVLLSFFLWFAVYSAVRFSSENWSGDLFVIGFALLMRDRQTVPLRTLVIAGALFGLAFTIRSQVSLMIFGLLAWLLFIRKVNISKLALLLVSMLIMVGVGIVIDRWFYGEWTLTVWNYFTENILHGKANAFGTEPWYTYVSEALVRLVPPFSLVFILAPIILICIDRRNALGWVILPFILVHSMIGHKEIRFLFPMVGLLPVVIVQAIELVRIRWSPSLLDNRVWRITAKAFVAVYAVFLGVIIFKPADAQISLYKTVYDEYQQPITIYNFGEDPYFRVAQFHFYGRPDLRMGGTITDSTTFNPKENFLVATMHPADVETRWPDRKLIYASLPAWVKHFNFNGWLERTDQWYVYQVTP
jgi:phosphatidylinositol glycan class B